nr:hypothetical protein [Tanacetum cinerariifolium]
MESVEKPGNVKSQSQSRKQKEKKYILKGPILANPGRIVYALCGDYLCGYHHLSRVYTIVNAPAGRLLGAYDLGVATPKAVVHASDKTSGDARSWYMISGDAKS